VTPTTDVDRRLTLCSSVELFALQLLGIGVSLKIVWNSEIPFVSAFNASTGRTDEFRTLEMD